MRRASSAEPRKAEAAKGRAGVEADSEWLCTRAGCLELFVRDDNDACASFSVHFDVR